MAELINLAINDKLGPIPLDNLSEEFKNKADPNKYIMIGTIKE